MATEARGAGDILREIDEAKRVLEGKQERLRVLLNGTKGENGERRVLPQEVEAIKAINGECGTLTQKINVLNLDYLQAKTEDDLARRSAEARPSMVHGDGNGAAPEAAKTVHHLPPGLGEAFVQSEGYRRWIHGSQGQLAHTEVEALNVNPYATKSAFDDAVKATLTTSGMTSIEKFPAVITLGQQMLTVADLFANAQTNNVTIRYLQETSFTNTAATVAENAQKPEATWALSEVDSPVKKIAWMARLTSEMYEDYPATRDYINQRLPFGVRQREEFQLLSGDGTGANLLGLLNVSGILTQAKGTDSNIDAIYKGITKVRTQGFWEPTAIVIDPTNWSAIRLLKTTTGDYVFGHPSVPGPETLFGKQVVITVNMGLSAANTAIVGAWNLGGTVFYRQGIRIEATNSDASDFAFNRIALRAEQREALAIWRPKAFATVTGLDV